MLCFHKLPHCKISVPCLTKDFRGGIDIVKFFSWLTTNIREGLKRRLLIRIIKGRTTSRVELLKYLWTR